METESSEVSLSRGRSCVSRLVVSRQVMRRKRKRTHTQEDESEEEEKEEEGDVPHVMLQSSGLPGTCDVA